MPDRDKVIKEFEEICKYTMRPHEFRVLNDVLTLLKEQQEQIWELQDQVEYLTDKLKEQKFFVDKSGKITPLPVVVRCKDCKWWDKKDDANYGYCHACKHGYYSDHWEIGIYRTYKGDWFCADGERREDDECKTSAEGGK